MKRRQRRKPRVEGPPDIWRDAALARAALETAAIPMFLADADGVLVHANRAFGDLLGYDAAALPRLDPQSLVHSDDVAGVREALARLAQSVDLARCASCAPTGRQFGCSPPRRRYDVTLRH